MGLDEGLLGDELLLDLLDGHAHGRLSGLLVVLVHLLLLRELLLGLLLLHHLLLLLNLLLLLHLLLLHHLLLVHLLLLHLLLLHLLLLHLLLLHHSLLLLLLTQILRIVFLLRLVLLLSPLLHLIILALNKLVPQVSQNSSGALFRHLAPDLLHGVSVDCEGVQGLVETDPGGEAQQVVIGQVAGSEASQEVDEGYWDLRQSVSTQVEYF